MIDRERIEERLRKLKECVALLNHYKKFPFKQFQDDPTLRGATERYLQLAIECVIDVSEILIANLRIRKPESGKDAIDILGEVKIIPDKFAFYFGPVAGFRNALVHDYLVIDYKKVYEHLQNDLTDFDKFARYIAKYLQKNK